uniref:Allantoate permease n=1 Tax=Kwoniella dejecticola CBS 10117 TaxID=1296121 RepID=A0A1A6AFJ9_9TREE|nr:uncharacterized protein I303_00669 [Kwoniella dejecticola CBS 10117]OBR88852.1 hypothetical protein I303_00669 [Kwoniella dejecticola CBS 10117]
MSQVNDPAIELGKEASANQQVLVSEQGIEGAKDQLDIAGLFLADLANRPNAQELLFPYTAAEERAVVRKADMIIVPLLLVALMMGAVDKNALSTAAILGLRTDLRLVGQEYSWTGSLIFFGSIASLFPALFAMQKYPAGRVVAGCVTVWGVVSLCIAACSNFAGLAVCRFVLGLFEALTFPGFSLIVSSWYTRKEQVVRTALIYSTLSSLTNGLLSYAASFAPNHLGVKAWQLLFLLIGAITFCWGILMGFFLPDSPVSARWLSDRQRYIAVMRLKDNRTGVENKHFKLSQAKEAFLDLKTWLIFLINICLNVPSKLAFNSIIVNGLGYSTKETLLLATPTGLISWCGSLLFSWIAIRTKQRCLTAAASCLLPLLSTILLHVIPRSNVGGSLGSLYLIYFYWAPYIVMTTVVIANTGGYTKKTIVYGMSYLGYLVGNIIGPQTFRANQAPAYTGGVIAMLACYCAGILLLLVYYFNLRRLKKNKEQWLADHSQEAAADDLLDDWRDETDFEAKRFQYVL